MKLNSHLVTVLAVLFVGSLIVGCPVPSGQAAGDSEFQQLSGVNLPWIHYGHDLGQWGTNTHDGFSSPESKAQLEVDFEYLRNACVKLVRVFLFCDLRAGFMFDAQKVKDDMNALLEVAEKKDIKLMLVLLDSRVADGTGPGEYPDLLDLRRGELIAQLKTFVSLYKDRDCIYAWDIMNEPDNINSAVLSWDKVKIFLGDAIEAINDVTWDSHQLVTVGCMKRKTMVEMKGLGNRGGGSKEIDIFQFHYYDENTVCDWGTDWQTGGPSISASALNLGKPVLVGEMQCKTVPSEMISRIQGVRDHGYAGVLFWSLRDDGEACPVPMFEPDTAYGFATYFDCASGQEEETIMLPGYEVPVPLEMVWIPAGTFMMGRYSREQDSDSTEDPQHQVTRSSGFWMGKYEVTQAQWQAVMSGANPSYFQGGSYGNTDMRPVEQVSWNAIQTFLTTLITATGRTFRLPTEAEWEYACRAGTTTRFYWGDDPSYAQIGNYAWYSGSATHDVGGKLPNARGLYDMSGNVWEWVNDWYGTYPSGSVTDPAGPASGSDRVIRGGGWNSYDRSCRSAYRTNPPPSSTSYTIGFRLAR